MDERLNLMDINASGKILSICIPTFNRCKQLTGLVNQIYDLPIDLLKNIEICISDNCSTDNTKDELSKFLNYNNFKYSRNLTNIGATANCSHVLSLASGRWALIIGDDDRFIKEGLITLLELLGDLDHNTWILSNFINTSGVGHLNKVRQGHLSSSELFTVLTRHGLNLVGFLSTHVIPRSSYLYMRDLTLDNIHGWPQIGLLSKSIYKCRFYVALDPVVKQAGGGMCLSWENITWLTLLVNRVLAFSYGQNIRSFRSQLVIYRGIFSITIIRIIIKLRAGGSTRGEICRAALFKIFKINTAYPIRFAGFCFLNIVAVTPVVLSRYIVSIYAMNIGDQMKYDTEITDGLQRKL